MKTILKTIVAIFAFAVGAHAGELVNHSGASKIGIGGYDPVAFVTEKAPTHGDPGIRHDFQGVTYLFSNEQTKATFAKSPQKYVPECGDFCAFGASVGLLLPVDISTWDIVDGKLYFTLNPEIQKAFNKDKAGNIKKAQKNWPKLVKDNS